MTRGGLSIDQKMVDNFIHQMVKDPSDLTNGIDIEPLTGKHETMTFSDLLNFMSRGLCLRLQSRERTTEVIKVGDIRKSIDLLKSGQDPVEYLRSQGYSDKVISKTFNS